MLLLTLAIKNNFSVVSNRVQPCYFHRIVSSCLYHLVLKNRNIFFLNYSDKTEVWHVQKKMNTWGEKTERLRQKKYF